MLKLLNLIEVLWFHQMHPERVTMLSFLRVPMTFVGFMAIKQTLRFIHLQQQQQPQKQKQKGKKKVKIALPLAHDAGYTQVGGSACHETRVHMQAANTLHICIYIQPCESTYWHRIAATGGSSNLAHL